MSMQATLAVREKMAQLLAADTSTLAPGTDANKIALIKADFTPSESLAIGDLELADFDGSTALAGVTGSQLESLDPGSNDSIIYIKPPAGGYRWETTGTTNLPQTIYGFALVSNDLGTLLGAEKFADPIDLTAVNQAIEIGPVVFRQLANSLN